MNYISSNNIPKTDQNVKPKSFFNLISIDNLLNEPLKDFEYIAKDFLIKGDSMIVAGSGGTYKSFLSLDIAFTIGLPGAKLWDTFKVTDTRRTMFLQSENSKIALRNRIDKLLKAKPHYKEAAKNIFFPENVNLTYTVKNDNFRLSIEHLLKENQIDLLVIDPLISFLYCDENKANEVREILDIFGAICKKSNTSLLIIDHHNKQGDYRGSSAKWDFARNFINISCTDDNIITINNDKSNNQEKFNPIKLKIVIDENSLSFEKVEKTNELSKKEKTKRENANKAYKCLMSMGGKCDKHADLLDKIVREYGISKTSGKNCIKDAKEMGYITELKESISGFKSALIDLDLYN